MTGCLCVHPVRHTMSCVSVWTMVLHSTKYCGRQEQGGGGRTRAGADGASLSEEDMGGRAFPISTIVSTPRGALRVVGDGRCVSRTRTMSSVKRERQTRRRRPSIRWHGALACRS